MLFSFLPKSDRGFRESGALAHAGTTASQSGAESAPGASLARMDATVDAAASAQGERSDAFDYIRRGPQLGDRDAIGTLELDLALQRLGVQLSSAELTAMIAEMNSGGSGRVIFDEFSAALPSVEVTCTERIITLLGGTKAERSEAYGLLDGLASRYSPDAERLSGWALLTQHAIDVSVALRCMEPLCKLACLSATEVDAQEYCRIGLLNAALASLDGRRLGWKWLTSVKEQWSATQSAFGVVLNKPAEDLTADDSLVAAAQLATMLEAFAPAPDECVRHGGSDEEFLAMAGAAPFLKASAFGQSPEGEKWNSKLSKFATDWLMSSQGKDPPLGSDYMRTGLCMLVGWTSVGRPEIAKRVVEDNYMQFVAESMRPFLSAPADLLLLSRQQSAFTFALVFSMVDSTTHSKRAGVDLEAHAVASGAIDACIGVLTAFETLVSDCMTQHEQAKSVGMSNSPGISGGIVACAVWFLSEMDYRNNAEAMGKLRGIPSALRFMLDNPIQWYEMMGMSTTSWGSKLVANVYGKDESESMKLRQQDVSDVITYASEIIHPKSVVGQVLSIDSNAALPILNMSVSDRNKKLLLACPEFIPTVIDGLLLDPAHPRQEGDLDSKCTLQRDCAEILQQSKWSPPQLSCDSQANPRARLVSVSVCSRARRTSSRPNGGACAGGTGGAWMADRQQRMRCQSIDGSRCAEA